MKVTIEHSFCPYSEEVTDLYFRIINTILFATDKAELRESMRKLEEKTPPFSYSFFPLIAARLPVPFYHLQWRTGSDCIPTFRSGMFSCAKVRRKNALQVPLSLPEVKFDVTFRNQRFRYS